MKGEQFNFRLSPELLKKLDDIRRGEPDIPTRAGVLRRLIEERAPAGTAAKEEAVGKRTKK
jgi:hypothetical protein